MAIKQVAAGETIELAQAAAAFDRWDDAGVRFIFGYHANHSSSAPRA